MAITPSRRKKTCPPSLFTCSWPSRPPCSWGSRIRLATSLTALLPTARWWRPSTPRPPWSTASSPTACSRSTRRSRRTRGPRPTRAWMRRSRRTRASTPRRRPAVPCSTSRSRWTSSATATSTRPTRTIPARRSRS